MTRKRPRPNDRRAGERGQALALFSVGLVALLVVTALVLDGGLAFVNRRDAQNSADFGALAGTKAIADHHIDGGGSSATVYRAIDQAVQDNGCAPDGSVPCTWTAEYVKPTTGYDTVTVGSGVKPSGAIPGSAQGVAVEVVRRPPSYFLRIIGQDHWDVDAEATAVTARLEGIGEGILLPIAFDPGRELKSGNRYQFSLGKDGPGAFSWLSWYDINSAVELERNVCKPRNPAYTFPVYIPSGPGKMNKKQVRDCLTHYIGTTVYIPLYDDCALGPGVTGNGSHVEYCIIGAAAFLFEGFNSNPAIDDVWGTLEEFVTYTSIPTEWAGPPCSAASVGCGSPTSFLSLIE